MFFESARIPAGKKRPVGQMTPFGVERGALGSERAVCCCLQQAASTFQIL